MRLKFTGLNEMRGRMQQIAKKFPDRVGAALYREAGIVLTESKRRCPVAPDGGTLRASGMVQLPEKHGNRVSVTITYGGAAYPYAIAVHEHLSKYSPPSWIASEISGEGVQWTEPSSGPKFLEGPINESANSMGARVAARIRENEKD